MYDTYPRANRVLTDLKTDSFGNYLSHTTRIPPSITELREVIPPKRNQALLIFSVCETYKLWGIYFDQSLSQPGFRTTVYNLWPITSALACAHSQIDIFPLPMSQGEAAVSSRRNGVKLKSIDVCGHSQLCSLTFCGGKQFDL